MPGWWLRPSRTRLPQRCLRIIRTLRCFRASRWRLWSVSRCRRCSPKLCFCSTPAKEGEKKGNVDSKRDFAYILWSPKGLLFYVSLACEADKCRKIWQKSPQLQGQHALRSSSRGWFDVVFAAGASALTCGILGSVAHASARRQTRASSRASENHRGSSTPFTI